MCLEGGRWLTKNVSSRVRNAGIQVNLPPQVDEQGDNRSISAQPSETRKVSEGESGLSERCQTPCLETGNFSPRGWARDPGARPSFWCSTRDCC